MLRWVYCALLCSLSTALNTVGEFVFTIRYLLRGLGVVLRLPKQNKK